MAESSRSVAKKAGAAALERTLETFMPALFQRLDQIDGRIAALDRELHGVQEHIENRFDQLRDGLKQLGERMARVEGTIEGFTRAVERQSDKMDQWIERLVRVEMTQGARRRGKRAS